MMTTKHLAVGLAALAVIALIVIYTTTPGRATVQPHPTTSSTTEAAPLTTISEEPLVHATLAQPVWTDQQVIDALVQLNRSTGNNDEIDESNVHRIIDYMCVTPLMPAQQADPLDSGMATIAQQSGWCTGGGR